MIFPNRLYNVNGPFDQISVLIKTDTILEDNNKNRLIYI